MKSAPCDLDVLLGRKKEAITHPGNLRLKRLVNMHLDTYTSIGRSAKTRMVFGIVEGIQEAGGTFLKFDDEKNEWKKIDNKGAREKVGHSFRDCLSSRKAQQKKASGPDGSKRTTKKRKAPTSRKRKDTSAPAAPTTDATPSTEPEAATSTRLPRRVSDTDVTVQGEILSRIDESLDEEFAHDQEPLPFRRGSSAWVLKSMEEFQLLPEPAVSFPAAPVPSASEVDHIMIGTDIPQDIFDEQLHNGMSFDDSATDDAWIVGRESSDALGDIVGV